MSLNDIALRCDFVLKTKHIYIYAY